VALIESTGEALAASTTGTRPMNDTGVTRSSAYGAG
jgi:hypothetical protein